MNRAESRQAVAAGVVQLVHWAHGTAFDTIPTEVLRRGARILADDLAAIVAARDESEVARFHARVRERANITESTVFRGGRLRTDRLNAAAANAVAADWLEVDEGYRKTPCHAGLYTIPSLIAEAEATNLPVSELLRALVVAYEIVTRIARAWTAPGLIMHPHARYSAIGASAAVGLARRLDESSLCAAVSSAVTLLHAGPRDHAVKGTLARNVWPASGALCGMMSVEWAQCGIHGVPEAFDDVFSTLLGNEPHPGQLTEQLGESWAVLDSYTKIHACCQQTHSAVEAALGLRDELAGQAALDEIESLTVESYPLAMPLVNYAPATTLAAKFSLPHVVASTMILGAAGVESFAARTLDAADIGALRAKVKIVPFDRVQAPPNDRPARITARLVDGREFQNECLSARGGPDRPFSDEALMQKIAALTQPVYPNLLPVLESIMGLEPGRMNQDWGSVVAEICSGSV